MGTDEGPGWVNQPHDGNRGAGRDHPHAPVLVRGRPAGTQGTLGRALVAGGLQAPGARPSAPTGPAVPPPGRGRAGA